MASLSTHIPKEITEYKEKVIGGILTKRQLAGLSGIILAGGLAYAICHNIFALDRQLYSYIIIAAAVPPAFWGFIPIQDMDLEDYLLLRYRHWQHSKPIAYKTTTRQGDSTYASKTQNHRSGSECITQFRIGGDRRRERPLIRAARRHIRKTCVEIRRSERDFRKRLKDA